MFPALKEFLSELGLGGWVGASPLPSKEGRKGVPDRGKHVFQWHRNVKSSKNSKSKEIFRVIGTLDS